MFSQNISFSWIYSADRRTVFVNLRVHIPETLLQLNGETRTVQATNNYNNLKVYLYFSEPVLNTSAQILKSLNISQGLLLPDSKKNYGNRRFGFAVSWFIDLIYRNMYVVISTYVRSISSNPYVVGA